MGFSEEKTREISKLLHERDAIQPCERCGSNSYMVDGYFRRDIQRDLQNTVNVPNVGPSTPTIVIICGHCKNISFSALQTLLPDEF